MKIVTGLVLLTVVVGLLLWHPWRPGNDTPEGVKADSVLAEDTTFQRQQAQGDSVRAELQKALQASQAESRHWKDSTKALLRKDAQDQAALDSTVAAGVPDSVAPAVFWKDKFEAQRRIAATLRLQTIPAYEAQIKADSGLIAGLARDTTELVNQRNEARLRVARVTETLADLREATKPGIRVLGLRLPSWTDDVLEVAGTATLVYAVTR